MSHVREGGTVPRTYTAVVLFPAVLATLLAIAGIMEPQHTALSSAAGKLGSVWRLGRAHTKRVRWYCGKASCR